MYNKILNEKVYRSKPIRLDSEGRRIEGIGFTKGGTNGKKTSNKYLNKNPIAKSFYQSKRQRVFNGHHGTTRSVNKSYNEELKTKINLLDFKRESYETQYNNYYNDNNGTPKVNRIRIKGYKFFDEFNNQIARVEVEYRNEDNIITIFEIKPKYKGFGFAKDLLNMSKTSLSANAAELDLNDQSKILFFESNGFLKIKIKKQTCILKLQNNKNMIDLIHYDENSYEKLIKNNNELYHTGGFEYEGYRSYI